MRTEQLRSKLIRLQERVTDVVKFGADDTELRKFIENINRFAWKKIDYNASPKRWLSEQVIREQDNELWKNLSNDKSSAKYFKQDAMDPTEGIFFVKTDFLVRKAGNKTGSLDKEGPIRKAFDKGSKLPTPQYWLGDGNLGEGNHRVMVAKERGLASVPVRVYWK